jgi:DNA-binding transcriptional LysR family regulator
MDEKDWLILQTIYEERNITKAADKLYTSQPSLTYRLQQMEEEVGVKIVWRSKKGIKFTSEGEYLVKYARNMLLEFQKTKDYLLNMNDNVEGIIRLGVSSNFAHYRLPSLLVSFLELYPNVQFKVKTGWSSEIFQLLQNEDVHIGIIRGDYHWLEQKVLISEESMCIISDKEIYIEDLPKLPRITYKTDPQLKQLINNWWHEHFIHPPLITMEVDKVQTCKEMVMHGLGYAIIPSICLKPHDHVQMIDLTSKNGEALSRKTWMTHRDSEQEFYVVKKFIEFVKQQAQLEELC